ncbi:MAG TPA: hypothetical protein VG708_03770 [Mycobacteriales bacterium]|nr:hypothetical protein [Mycobacteriales bacterium]
MTVDSIEKGSLSDFNGIQLDAAQRAGTPEYVKVHITNLGPAPVKGSEASVAIEGVDNTGQTQQSLTFIGDFPKCTENESQAQLGRGDTFQTCLTFLVPGGITKAAYVNGTDYIESPVTWAAG